MTRAPAGPGRGSVGGPAAERGSPSGSDSAGPVVVGSVVVGPAAVGLAVLGTLVLFALAVAGRRGDAGAGLLGTSTVAGVLAVGALAAQPWLAGARRRARRVHTTLGVVALGCVVVHVVALLLLSPDDALFAMSPAGPTRARMAVLALVLLALVGLLGGARRRSGWAAPTWRLLHAGFAVLAVALGVGHAVLTDGALDVVAAPAGAAVLLLLGGLGVAGTAAPALERRARAGRVRTRPRS